MMDTKYINNTGSLFVFNSNLTFMQNTTFLNNTSPAGQIEQGGALTTFQSNIFTLGQIHMLNNHAENGGAIHSIESKFQVYESIKIANNVANQTGGGIYLYQSELVCHEQSKLELQNNYAKDAGGGIYTCYWVHYQYGVGSIKRRSRQFANLFSK